MHADAGRRDQIRGEMRRHHHDFVARDERGDLRAASGHDPAVSIPSVSPKNVRSRYALESRFIDLRTSLKLIAAAVARISTSPGPGARRRNSCHASESWTPARPRRSITGMVPTSTISGSCGGADHA